MKSIEISSNSQELKRGFYEFNEYEPKIVGYAGKIINGKPMFTGNVELPENTDIIIVINTKKTVDMTTPNTEEIEKRRGMVNSLKGCLVGYEINLDEIREERIAKRGSLE